jgi:hypothetical protein
MRRGDEEPVPGGCAGPCGARAGWAVPGRAAGHDHRPGACGDPRSARSGCGTHRPLCAVWHRCGGGAAPRAAVQPGPGHRADQLSAPTGAGADRRRDGRPFAKLRADVRAVRLDLPDFVEFLLGTGMRIGEVAAVRDQVHDLTAGTVRVEATVVRVPGAGLRIEAHTKTPASRRTLALPGNVIAMVRDRAVGGREAPDGVVFPSPRRMLRDPSNTQADLRAVLDGVGYGWVTSNNFRKTVATRLDEVGLTAREIADQLGHGPPVDDPRRLPRPSPVGQRRCRRRARSRSCQPGGLLVVVCSFLVL